MFHKSREFMKSVHSYQHACCYNDVSQQNARQINSVSINHLRNSLKKAQKRDHICTFEKSFLTLQKIGSEQTS
jgi:hypothetical protein